MKSGATFSRCRQYRYEIWRQWDAALPFVLFIGLNPSKADETHNDPTITRCINFARDWGYGGVWVANLFALCATYPEDLKRAAKPVGRSNNQHLLRLSARAGLTVAAWGNDGAHLGRSSVVGRLLPDLHCLAINKSGEPAHPLYQRASTRPTAWIKD